MTRAVTSLRLKATLIVLACIAGLWEARERALFVERQGADKLVSARACCTLAPSPNGRDSFSRR